MGKLLLVIGICQIIAGVVILGLVGTTFNEVITSNTATDVQKVQAFGPVMIPLLVIVNGIFGVLTMCCSTNKKMDVFYLMGAAIAASASAAMVWLYALVIKECETVAGQIINIFGGQCSEETRNINISILVFSSICCVMSVLGMVATSLTVCRKL